MKPLIFFVAASYAFAVFGQFKAVIFDCDGVLVDNGNAYFLDWQHAMRTQGFELMPVEFWEFMHRNDLVGYPNADPKILDFCCSLLGKDCREALQREKDAFSKALHDRGFPPIDATVAFVKKLSEQKTLHHCKLAVASASGKERILSNLRRFGIEECFDLVVSGQDDLKHVSDPEGVNKPKPYIYEYAAMRLSAKPSECVVIEDSKTGVRAAVSAGCFTIAIPTEATCKQDLSLAQVQMESLAELDPRDFFIFLEEKRSAVRSVAAP